MWDGKGGMYGRRQWGGREDEYLCCLFQDLQQFLSPSSQAIEMAHASCELLHYSKKLLNADDVKEYQSNNCRMCWLWKSTA